jgi:hypothetical protein
MNARTQQRRELRSVGELEVGTAAADERMWI